MAKPTREVPKRKFRYFYIDGRLHKVLHVNRPEDIVNAWDYPERKRKTYIWSDVQRRMQQAFTISEVAKIVGRHRLIIDHYIRDGHIPAPQRIYSIDGKFTPGKYMFSEDDVLKLHDFMLTVHRGRPRKDGLITNAAMPSRSELRAIIKSRVLLYIKNEDGEYVPVWKEQIW